jgi:hypothetical protein
MTIVPKVLLETDSFGAETAKAGRPITTPTERTINTDKASFAYFG